MTKPESRVHDRGSVAQTLSGPAPFFRLWLGLGAEGDG